MHSPLDKSHLTEVSSALFALKKPLVLAHARPDCDAIGAMMGMRSLFRVRNIEPLCVQFNPTPVRYVALTRYEPMKVWLKDVTFDDLDGVDGVIVLDTCSYKQLDPLADWLQGVSVPKFVVDHHVTRDELADYYVIDEHASATCLILTEWARMLEWSLDEVAAHALFVGIATDTGWFAHANTDTRTMVAASHLMECGVSANDVYRHLYQTDTPARLRLQSRLLDTLELYAGDKLAVMSVSASAFEELKARMSDAEDMINEPLRIRSVEVSILIIDQGTGVIRVSFRSKVPIGDTTRDVDVSRIAQSFGGGGHKRAAGARPVGEIQEVKEQVVARVLEDLV